MTIKVEVQPEVLVDGKAVAIICDIEVAAVLLELLGSGNNLGKDCMANEIGKLMGSLLRCKPVSLVRRERKITGLPSPTWTVKVEERGK